MRRPRPLGITDHALLRWLERRHGIDVDVFRNAMADDVAAALARADENADPMSVQYVVEEGCVVTVLGVGERPGRRKHVKMGPRP